MRHGTKEIKLHDELNAMRSLSPFVKIHEWEIMCVACDPLSPFRPAGQVPTIQDYERAYPNRPDKASPVGRRYQIAKQLQKHAPQQSAYEAWLHQEAA